MSGGCGEKAPRWADLEDLSPLPANARVSEAVASLVASSAGVGRPLARNRVLVKDFD